MLPPQYSSDEERRQAYQNERPQRWGLEEALLDPIASLICRVISSNLGYQARYTKYAEPLIADFKAAHPSQPIPDDVRGAPDLKMHVNKHEWLVELKIKKHRFHNTLHGSSSVSRYGCESHYLDEVPVYANLLKHAHNYQIDTKRIILLYAVNPQAASRMPVPLKAHEWQFECVSLFDLKKHIDAGRYQRFGQGYGQTTWLLRCDDMQDLATTFV